MDDTTEQDASNGAPKFNWVTERSSCSLVFQALRLEVEEDVKTRNTLRPENSPYEFSVAHNGNNFTVLLKAEEGLRSVVFSLAGRAIIIRDDKGNQMFEVTVAFSEQGKCKFKVNKEEHELWQVRRIAVEDLMFRGY